MRYLILIFSLLFPCLKAQDKLFLIDGTSKKGIIVSKAKDFVFFKTSDTSSIEKINRSKILLIEDYKGNRHLFSQADTRINPADSVSKKQKVARNLISLQPYSLILGRATVLYERFSEDDKMGFVVPIILTFDPYGSLLDSNQNTSTRSRDVRFITGLDLNFYFGTKRNSKFFIGPRFRYGTDLLLGGIEAYSLQTQIGWKLNKPQKRVVRHLSIGFGLIRVLYAPGASSITKKRSYPWFSINYRVGIKW